MSFLFGKLGNTFSKMKNGKKYSAHTYIVTLVHNEYIMAHCHAGKHITVA